MRLPPIDITADILHLPVKPREPVSDESFLVPVPHSKCIHFNGPFEIDVKGGRCVCKRCNEEVSPIFVLEQLMNQESRWMRTRAAYQDEMQRLDARSKTKCQHCGAITRISKS